MRISFAAFVLLVATASVGAPREATFAADLDEAIGRAVDKLPAVPGVAVAVYTRDGRYVRAFGVTDTGRPERASADTAFYIASATKSLTALALAQLDARHELDLDATLSAYAPDAEFPAAVRPREVTLRNLLAHTSGIENDPIGFRVAYSGEHDPALLWSLLPTSVPNPDAPLGKFAYTNVGYNIATMLTERRLGKTWQELVEREVIERARLTRTSTSMSKAQARRWSVAMPHMWSPVTGHSERIDLVKTDRTMQSAGGVIMSANDACRWLELFAEDGRIAGRQRIPAAIIRSTRTPLAGMDESRDGFSRQQYGLGWYIGRWRDDAMLMHFGGFPGARSHVSYLPGRHEGVAVFINDGSVSSPVVDLIAKFVYDRLHGLPAARAEFDAAVDALAVDGPARFVAALADRAARPWKLSWPRANYPGVYVSSLMGTLTISAQGDELRADIGILHAVATPYTEQDAMRAEFAPGQGDVLRFEFAGGDQPVALRFGGERFARVATAPGP